MERRKLLTQVFFALGLLLLLGGLTIRGIAYIQKGAKNTINGPSSDEVVMMSTEARTMSVTKAEEGTTQAAETEVASLEVKPELLIPDPTEQNPPETVPETKSDTIMLLAVGDNLFHKPLSDGGQKPDGSWDFSDIYAKMKTRIQSADIAIINQETPMAGESYGIHNYPKFNVPQQLAATMHEVGFRVVSFATNHSLDMGVSGLKDTVSYWHENYPDVLCTGAYTSQKERDAVGYLEQNGMKIAFLNYTYGTNSKNTSKEPYLLNYYSAKLATEDIQKAREICDFIVVLMHWGTESQTVPNATQKQMAMELCEAGADLIIGSHPHVVQPVEWVIAPNGHRALCYYSLGNFVSLQSREPRMLEGVARVTLQIRTDETGHKTLAIREYCMDFCVMHFCYEEKKGIWDACVYPFEEYTEELAKTHGLWNMGAKLERKTFVQMIEKLGRVSEVCKQTEMETE